MLKGNDKRGKRDVKQKLMKKRDQKEKCIFKRNNMRERGKREVGVEGMRDAQQGCEK
jgi:hypothetical protein